MDFGELWFVSRSRKQFLPVAMFSVSQNAVVRVKRQSLCLIYSSRLPSVSPSVIIFFPSPKHVRKLFLPLFLWHFFFVFFSSCNFWRMIPEFISRAVMFKTNRIGFFLDVALEYDLTLGWYNLIKILFISICLKKCFPKYGAGPFEDMERSQGSADRHIKSFFLYLSHSANIWF